MKLGKVEKKSIWYNIFYAYVAPAFTRIFYKKAYYIGVENIPKNTPVMIAPNHQNAVMDALAVIFSQRYQVVFLARSDVFTNPIIAKILFFLKILPVYRLRDGKEKLANNEAIFNKSVEVLEKSRRVAIFPEAQHIDKRHLRVLQKGVQRVAFTAEAKNDFKLGIQIVPTGIYYSNYWNFRTILQVRYGKPIAVADYKEIYLESEQKAMIALRDEMSIRIKEQIIDIHDLKNYDNYEVVRDVCDVPMMKKSGSKRFTPDEKFSADKKVIAATEQISAEKPEIFQNLMEKCTNYTEFLKKENLKDYVFEKQNSAGGIIAKLVVLLLAFPIFIYGALNNLIPYLLPRFITNNIEDRQFESSVTFGMGLFAFPIFYAIQTVIFGLITGLWLYALAYLVSLPVFGLLAFGYHRFFVRFKSSFKVNRKRSTPEYQTAEANRNFIIETVVNN